jgi:diadenosine tetraphosphate (Ap4A) HIT family hydrolase
MPSSSHFHLHLHLIPRTNILGTFLREYKSLEPDSCDVISTIIAYDIYKISGRPNFPSQYKYDRRNPEHQYNALQLMNYLRANI